MEITGTKAVVKDRGMSDHTRPDVPVLMETLILFLIWDLDHRLITHHRNIRKGPTPGGNSMDANFSLVQSDW